MQAMILAAGFGKRLRPHTLLRPKPLFPVLGRPLVLRLVRRLRRAGFDRILVNCHHLAGAFEPVLAGESGVSLQYEDIELGTGGGLRRGLAWFRDEPLLVMNGDIFHDYDPGEIYRRHLDSGARISMLLHDQPRFNNVTLDDSGRIRGFRWAGGGGRLLAYTGIQVLDPSLLGSIPADTFCDLIDFYQDLIDEVEIRGMTFASPAYWRDMGTAADYLGLHDDLFAGRSRSLRPGSSLLIAPSARVAEDLAAPGWAVIGERAEVGGGCRLSRCVVWDHARIPAGTHAENQVITG